MSEGELHIIRPDQGVQFTVTFDQNSAGLSVLENCFKAGENIRYYHHPSATGPIFVRREGAVDESDVKLYMVPPESSVVITSASNPGIILRIDHH